MPSPGFEEELYYLSELKLSWGVADAELRRWIVGGKLVTHVWLPLMSVFGRRYPADSASSGWELRHWEGFCGVSRDYCFRLFRSGKINLREFHNDEGSESYRLPDTAEDLVVYLDDLVVLEQERRRFEGVMELVNSEDSRFAARNSPPTEKSARYVADSAFKIVRYGDDEYVMGNMQAAVLRELHERSNEGSPWQSGKAVLRSVGSQSYSLSNVFKRNPIWREIVLSDGRGCYRIASRCLRVEDR